MFWKWRNRDRRNQKYCLRLKKKEDVRIHVWNHTSDEKEYSIKEEQSRLISARSSLSSRCTVSRVWKGREIQREGEDHGEKRWGIYLKWHRLDPRRPPKDLFPRRAALSEEKRGAVLCYPFLPSSSLLLPPLRISFLSSPFFLFFFALHSRKRAVSCHLRSSSSECHERINAINRLEEGFFFFFYRETGKFLWNFYLLLSFYLLLFLRMFVVGVGLDSNLKIERMIRMICISIFDSMLLDGEEFFWSLHYN